MEPTLLFAASGAAGLSALFLAVAKLHAVKAERLERAQRAQLEEDARRYRQHRASETHQKLLEENLRNQQTPIPWQTVARNAPFRLSPAPRGISSPVAGFGSIPRRPQTHVAKEVAVGQNTARHTAHASNDLIDFAVVAAIESLTNSGDDDRRCDPAKTDDCPYHNDA